MRKYVVIHPFLFGAFPVLFLYTHNLDMVTPGIMLRPLIITGIFTALLLLLFTAVYKNIQKAGLVSSIYVVMFFSFGHILDIANRLYPNVGVSSLRVYLSVLMSLVFVLTAMHIAHRRWYESYLVSVILNTMALALVAMPFLSAGYAFANRPQSDNRPEILAHGAVATATPDIYLIILDGYARHDTMKDIYGYDNSEFLDFLGEHGFFIAQKATSNYAQTYLSLSATLNIKYLEKLAPELGDESDDRAPLMEMLRDNSVVSFLKDRGYMTVAYASGYTGTEMVAADKYIRPFWNVSEFENILIYNTPLGILAYRNLYGQHRERVLMTLNNIPDIERQGKPVFVFAHVVCPHPPFVFGEDGTELLPDKPYELNDGNHFIQGIEKNRATYKAGYGAQARFISGKVMEMVDRLMSKPGPKPVVVIIADHGPGLGLDWHDPSRADFRERFSILNAMYLPDGNYDALCDEITTVNTFRVILNKYFGTDLELLPDRSYFSTWDKPYNFLDVTQEVHGGVPAESKSAE